MFQYLLNVTQHDISIFSVDYSVLIQVHQIFNILLQTRLINLDVTVIRKCLQGAKAKSYDIYFARLFRCQRFGVQRSQHQRNVTTGLTDNNSHCLAYLFQSETRAVSHNKAIRYLCWNTCLDRTLDLQENSPKAEDMRMEMLMVMKNKNPNFKSSYLTTSHSSILMQRLMPVDAAIGILDQPVLAVVRIVVTKANRTNFSHRQSSRRHSQDGAATTGLLQQGSAIDNRPASHRQGSR
jgi:hypothetical protein